MSEPAPSRLSGRLGALAARLPPGAVAVAGGLAVSGLTAYVYLVIASRALGPDRYSPLSALWALIFVAAPGLFLPLEQEVGRALSARRVAGLGWRPVLARAATLGALLVVALLVVATAASRPIIDRLFDGQALLFVGFAVAVASYAGYFLARGTLAGTGRFGTYGWLLTVESGLRVGATIVLAVLGIKEAGIYSLAIGIPAIVAVLVILPRQRGLAPAGPPAAWSELGTALALLLAGSLFAQLLINIGPLAVKVIVTDDSGAAGRFLDGVIVARVPLFFFQAIQASLLPRLSAQAAAHLYDEFRATLRNVLVLVAGLVVVSVLGMLALGPLIVRILFGQGYALGRGDLGLLAFGSEMIMACLALAQGCIALGAYGRAAAGWATGVAAVALAIAVIPGSVLRVEIAFCIGTTVATVALGIALSRRLAEVARGDATPSVAPRPGAEVPPPLGAG